MTIWITRTLPAAKESAQAWTAAGFACFAEPLLEIEAVPHESPKKNDTLIFTSKNGIDHVECRGQIAICVGDATAQKARDAGYRDVISVDGTSKDITTWVKANLSTGESLCHISGWHVRGTIVEDLAAAGFSARRVKTYRSLPRLVWPNEVLSGVALYSPLAAQTFARVAKEKDLSEVTAICISAVTADALQSLHLKSIQIAKRPREDELIMAAKLNPPSALEV